MNQKKRDKISHMIDFIIAEANEKGEEIRVQTEEEFSIGKQTLVEENKKNIRHEYERKEKSVKINQKIVLSNMKKEQRIKLLKYKEQIVNRIREKCLVELLKKLTPEMINDQAVEALIKMNETTVSIQCRKEDEEKLDVEGIKKKYLGITKKVIEKLEIDPTLKENHGVVVYGLGDRIKIDNTIEFRLDYAVEMLMPLIKEKLFEIEESN